MEQRRCKKCGVPKPLIDFATAGVINNVQYYRHKCKKCYLEFKNDYRRDKKSQLDEYKKNLECADCGLKDFRVIEFHHPDENKEHNVGDMLSFGLDKIMVEVKKCVPLCANCHRIRHYIIRTGE
jgi:hypothetical protein